MDKKQKTILVGVIIVVLAAIIIFAGFFINQSFSAKARPGIQTPSQSQQQPAENIPQQPAKEQSSNLPEANQAPGLKTFKDSYGFQMQYPSDAKVMNAPTSEIIACSGSCPGMLTVNGIESIHADQMVNGIKYCIYSGGSAKNGNIHNEYLYLTVSNNICYGLDVSYSSANCTNYPTDSAKKDCESKNSANQALIGRAVSTIKFSRQ